MPPPTIFYTLDRSPRTVFGRFQTLRPPDPRTAYSVRKGLRRDEEPHCKGANLRTNQNGSLQREISGVLSPRWKNSVFNATSMALLKPFLHKFPQRGIQAYVNPSFTSCPFYRYKPSTTAEKRCLQEADFLLFFTISPPLLCKGYRDLQAPSNNFFQVFTFNKT